VETCCGFAAATADAFPSLLAADRRESAAHCYAERPARQPGAQSSQRQQMPEQASSPLTQAQLALQTLLALALCCGLLLTLQGLVRAAAPATALICHAK